MPPGSGMAWSTPDMHFLHRRLAICKRVQQALRGFEHGLLPWLALGCLELGATPFVSSCTGAHV